jgi:outer membrane protein assembly factor BamB
MSAIQSKPSTPAAHPVTPPRPHRYWIPLLVLILVTAALAVPWLLHELDQVPDNLQGIAAMIEMIGVPSVAGLIFLWWLLLSGFSWRARLAGILVLAAAIGGFVYSITGKPTLVLVGHYYLLPSFRFKWQTTPEQYRANYAASEDKKELPPIDLTIRPSDYPRFRGPGGDGIAHAPALARDWSSAQLRVLYRRPCLYGYSGFAVAGNVVITMEQRDGKEVVVCFDRATGRERWTSEPLGQWNDPTNMGDGPRSTPTIDDRGQVFAYGATGILVCLDGASGKQKWRADTMEECAAKPIRWGQSGSPLIVDEMVIVNPGIDPAKPANRAVAAYDRTSGKREWAEGNHNAGYSSPRLVTLCGKRQILLFDGDGLAGIDPDKDKGKELWRYAWDTQYGMNNIQPLVYGTDCVFISSELTNGSAMVRVKKGPAGWTAEEAWRPSKYRFWSKFSNPVLVGEGIYGLSAGDLYCYDAESGTLRWKERSRGRFGEGQLVANGDQLIVQSDDGKIFLVAAETTAYKELGSLQVLERDWKEPKPKTWNTPALAGNQLFLRDNEREMACVELPTR